MTNSNRFYKIIDDHLEYYELDMYLGKTGLENPFKIGYMAGLTQAYELVKFLNKQNTSIGNLIRKEISNEDSFDLYCIVVRALQDVQTDGESPISGEGV